MPITDKVERIRIAEINIDRKGRQRREINVDDLLPSIKLHGVLNPIIVDKDLWLKAGERRLTAATLAGHETILVRYFESLDEIEHDIIEWEENARRADLPWQDQAHAINAIHNKLLKRHGEDWSKTKTAEKIGLSVNTVASLTRVAEELSEGNEKIAAAPSWRAAYNMIARTDDRKQSDALADLLSITSSSPMELPHGETPEGVDIRDLLAPASKAIYDLPEGPAPTVSSPILVADFHQWAAQYSGPPFNFLHCDFPYGIDLQDSEQANTAQWGGYQDQEKLYWDLLHSLAANQDKIMSSSCHIMFWFSMNFYVETRAFFAEHLPSIDLQPHPIYWHKTDGRGILPDPKRGPRRVVETAFIGSRGDRQIVRSVANCYGAPTHKSIHQSEKSRPMLSHFFQMFVDENTRMLDPTCGSGNSLQAATILKASTVLGLELDPSFAADAQSEFKKFSTLRSLGGTNVD